MKTFDQFYSENNNRSVEIADPTAKDQCMDLIFAWCLALGIPISAVGHQYAYQVWSNPTNETRKYFDLIQNGPDNVAVKGDILVFKQVVGIPIGHVSIETGKSDMMNAVTFDQNWDTVNYNHGVDPKTGLLIPYCRTVIHSNYYGVVGWLHPKNIINYDEKIKQLKISIDRLKTELDAELANPNTNREQLYSVTVAKVKKIYELGSL
jgi:hypothetical protein